MTTTPTPNDCCDSGDGLWIKIKGRKDDCQQHHGQSNYCYWIDLNDGYALSPTKETFPNEPIPNLLVPTTCIKGIECPTIWEHDTPNYWDLAWEKLAKVHLHSHLDSIGMAINAKHTKSGARTRNFNQLHIHVSRIAKNVQSFLQMQDNNLKTPSAWNILKIKDPKGEERNYRVLKITKDDDLSSYNLFRLVHAVSEVGDANMQYQTLIVAKRPKSGQYKGEGFYILNSDTSSPSLNPGGIGDGERLLYEQ